METQNTEAAMGAFGLVIGGIFIIILIVSFICWIKVLIALFKKEGAGLGILGLLCGIYLYIWGWMKSKELGLKSTMIWWTLTILAALVLWVVAGVGMLGIASQNPEFKKAFEEEMQRQQQLQQPPPPAAPQN
jgi:hypothetical protein